MQLVGLLQIKIVCRNIITHTTPLTLANSLCTSVDDDLVLLLVNPSYAFQAVKTASL